MTVNDPPGLGILIPISLLLCALPALAVDSRACAPCHAAIYKSYQATGMARSSGHLGTGTFRESLERAEFAGPGGAAQYRVSREADGLGFDFHEGDVKGRRRLDYFVGSGAVGRSYLTAIDGFLFQAPVSYYSGPARWSLSPGFERATGLNLMRGVEPGCLNCHASGVRAIEGTTNGYAKLPFLEGGVGCERCHGAGEEHMAQMKSGKRTASSGIVNPVKLDAPRRDSVCAQCHLPGAVEIARPGKQRSYRPGDKLDDSVVVFVWEGANRETTVNGHFEQLARSACRRSSAGKLWCGTCHDPHAVVAETEKATFYRSRCQTCHESKPCTAPADARATERDNCIACHMTRTPSATVQHAAFTDHSIPRRPRAVDGSPAIPAGAALAAFDGFRSGDRELGLAYATVAIADNNRAWGMRAFELLQKANAETPDDAKVASKLAELYDRMGKEDLACALYARVVAADAAQNAAAVNLGTCLAKQGGMDESIRLWKSALERSPVLEAARLNLAVALYRSGNVAGAQAALREGLKFNPAFRKATALLREMEGR